MVDVTLRGMVCGTCGTPHAIPDSLYETCKAEGGFWHCPNGHKRGWSEGTIQSENKRLKQQIAQRDDEIREAQAATAKAEKQLAETKRRAHAGVCPCCKRTFSNVQHHMRKKHPNVVPIARKAGSP